MVHCISLHVLTGALINCLHTCCFVYDRGFVVPTCPRSLMRLSGLIMSSFLKYHNDFRTFPYGNVNSLAVLDLNRFILWCTASAKAACGVSVTCAQPY